MCHTPLFPRLRAHDGIICLINRTLPAIVPLPMQLFPEIWLLKIRYRDRKAVALQDKSPVTSLLHRLVRQQT
jgi:hypothetical protein